MTEPHPRHSSRFEPRLTAAFEAMKRERGMTAQQFGYVHFGDPNFLRRMRGGVRLQKRTVEKIERLLVTHERL